MIVSDEASRDINVISVYLQVLHFVEEFDAFLNEFLRGGVCVQVDIFTIAAVVAHCILVR